MAASVVSHSRAATACRLRHLPLTRRFMLPAIPRLHLPTGTLYPAARISRCADAPTPLRSNRRPLSPPLAMAYEATPAATAANGKQGLLVFDSEEELSVSLPKYTAELSEKFVQERRLHCGALRRISCQVPQEIDGISLFGIGGLGEMARVLGG
ncbi:hypothetical protein MUK42_31964 [Musa troglodytarum]|uniref:Uncharacterized protein n=1 Tax=Musa troglodytarum TaxID=320322 RepID=A0A9E7L7N2_9LILI|nr:hypothetical protein MUK42_31964 [Musa troglodytarum]URE40983.1 hypothetical protein MUK42_31964 [Musa troglodytarum]URE40984.1 hypothetical protein MUK42_31964 [Musa troglodytarum]URE40985.1 hypothetical protein MUK42_31964 [Musa troglodytarum]URE40986.1 hypothetical protein MUK42_31964 [Musa troglodytarum]